RLDRGSAPEGLALTPAPGGADWCAGKPVVGGVFSSVRCGLLSEAGVRSLFIPSPPAGVAWSGTPQPGGVNQCTPTAPPLVGVTNATTSRPGCAGSVLTRVGPGNGCARRVARSRPA